MLQEQEMIAEAYKEAQEIWATMTDEELAVSPPLFNFRKWGG
jgi:hypothetical protein